MVGTIDGTVVGYGVSRLATLADGSQLAVVTDLYVDPEARGVGLGEAMMDLLVAHADRGGCGRASTRWRCRATEPPRTSSRRSASRRGPSWCTGCGSASGAPDGADDRPELCVSAVVVDDDRLLLVRRGRGPRAGQLGAPRRPGRRRRDARRGGGARAPGGDRHRGRLRRTPRRGGDRSRTTAPTRSILGHRVTLMESTDPVAGDDAAEARWVPLVDVTDLYLAPGLAEFLHDHQVIATIT